MILALLTVAAWSPAAQTPLAPPRAPDICLTNACAPGPGLLVAPRNQTAVTAAIASKNVGALIRAGGTAREAGDILRSTCGPGNLPCRRIAKAGTEEFRVAFDGSVVIYGAAPDDSDMAGGKVFVNTDDMAGLKPTAGMKPVDDPRRLEAPAKGMTLLPPPPR